MFTFQDNPILARFRQSPDEKEVELQANKQQETQQLYDTLYHLISNKQLEEVTQIIQEKGVGILDICPDEETLLVKFVLDGNKEAVAFLLKYAAPQCPGGVDINRTNRANETAMHEAAKLKNRLEILDLLLKHNASRVNVGHKFNGTTMLHSATIVGEPAVIECLLRYGAQAGITDCEGRNAFHFANKLDALQVLLKAERAEEDLKWQCSGRFFNGTPLFMACFNFLSTSNQDIEVVRALFYANKKTVSIIPSANHGNPIRFLLMHHQLKNDPKLIELISEMLPYSLPFNSSQVDCSYDSLKIVFSEVIKQNKVDSLQKMIQPFKQHPLLYLTKEKSVFDWILDIVGAAAFQSSQQKHTTLEMILIFTSQINTNILKNQPRLGGYLADLGLITYRFTYKWSAAQAAYKAVASVREEFESMGMVLHQDPQKNDIGFQKKQIETLAALTAPPLRDVPFSESAFALNYFARQITLTTNQDQITSLINIFFQITEHNPKLAECNQVLSQILKTTLHDNVQNVLHFGIWEEEKDVSPPPVNDLKSINGPAPR